MNRVEQILSQKQIRITPMRELVLEAFLKTDHTIGLTALENIFPRADRITMYRTLKTFEEKGIIHQVEHSGNAEVQYALCKEHCLDGKHIDQHPHFECVKCGNISCLENVLIPPLDIPRSFQIQEQRMLVKGVCPDCQ